MGSVTHEHEFCAWDTQATFRESKSNRNLQSSILERQNYEFITVLNYEMGLAQEYNLSFKAQRKVIQQFNKKVGNNSTTGSIDL